MEEAPPLEKFILPGGSPAAATLHIARTVARRAERQTVTLMKAEEDVPPVVHTLFKSGFLITFSLQHALPIHGSMYRIMNMCEVRKCFRTDKKKEDKHAS